jgi:FkbM family methyltransferase
MKVFNTITKVIIFPIYYVIHKNIVFGFFHKNYIKKFYYKDIIINLNIRNIPLPNYSSFLFKTYEYNDRVLVEKNINKKNKCIVIGGGLGFIPSLAYKKSLNKILVFEIDKKILKNLRTNLNKNFCKFDIIDKCLDFNQTSKNIKFYLNEDFLCNSKYEKSQNHVNIKTISHLKVKNFDKYNTLIIDAEGFEYDYIKNLNRVKHIKYIIFELHNNLLTNKEIKRIFHELRKHKFYLKDKCFNSYYFSKI